MWRPSQLSINKNRFAQHWGVKTLLKQVCSNYGAIYIYIYNNLTHQHIVNLFIETTAKGFGKEYTNFSGMLPMHAWILTVSNLGQIFPSDLDVGAHIL